MASFAAYMSKLQELTEMNLSLLNLINDSLYSNAEHVTANINGTDYSIPSFIYIENKLNNLEGNWNRLVNAPVTGEAAFVFDGQTKQIHVNGFENAPMPITLHRDDNFYVENNDIFKDFISPLLYLKYNLQELPDHIKEVNVRKVAIMNSDLISRISDRQNITWAEMNSILMGYTDDVDYSVYDKIYKLPIKHSDYNGLFKVTDSRADNTSPTIIGYTVTLDTLNYTYDNGTLSKALAVDDYLITEGDECKYRVTSVDYNAKRIGLECVSGYKRIDNGDTLKFIRNQELFDDQKFIKVPLEEDKCIVLFMSAINSNINLQSAWSDGQIINVDNLRSVNDEPFREVYNSRIRNIGDILFDLTKFNTTSLSNVSDKNLKDLTEYKPVISADDYSVVLLNEHLLDNTTVEQIRKLNVQKAEINNNLVTIQENIDNINSQLATTDFSTQDPSVKADLEATLSKYNTQRDGYIKDLNNIINQITINSTSSSIPVSNSKYVIAGGIKYKDIESHFADTSRAKVIRFELLYRYKNINKDASSAAAINDVITVSDWNKYIVDYRQKEAKYVDGTIQYIFEDNNDDSTTGRWCTYQIPITRGETVDIRYRVQYDLGYPYVSIFSDWSDVINVEFPEDLIADSDINTIAAKNAEDSKLAVIKSELLNGGITYHINDKVIDQELTYYHRPESIASGFYTEDSRRVISLKEKLFDLSNQINELKNGVFGSNYKDIEVRVGYSKYLSIINPNTTGAQINIPNYKSLENVEGTNMKQAVVTIYISNKNTSSPIHLYSMYPGDGTQPFNDINARKSKWYSISSQFNNVYMKLENPVNGSNSTNSQFMNQIIYFRTKSAFTNNEICEYSEIIDINSTGMAICPYIMDIKNLQPATAVPGDYITLNPGDVLAIPIYCKIKMTPQSQAISKKVSFDIWNSPFHDPLTYTFDIIANYQNREAIKAIDNIKNKPYKVMSI